MSKVALWVGAGLLLAGVALGFVKDGTCGSVFQPRDDQAAQVNRMLGQDVRNCYDALDLTVPVWLLIGVGAVTLTAAGLGQYAARADEREREERARRHARLNPSDQELS